MKKYSFIINPVAGSFNAEHVKNRIKSASLHKDISIEIFTTLSPNHATEIVQRLTTGKGSEQYIISVGGDGTLNEIINGIPDNPGNGKNLVLGIVPAGSGNDFIKNLNYPKKINDVIDFVLSDNYNIQSAKYGIVEYRNSSSSEIQTKRFINAMGIGFDAYVAHLNQRNKRLPGMVSYVIAVMSAFKDLQFINCELKLDNEAIKKDVVLLTVGNGQCSGGGFYLTPNGNPFRPKLDLTVVEKCRKSYILRKLPTALFNTLDRVPEAHFFEFEELSIILDKPYFAHADGEVIGNSIKELCIRAKKNSINIITGN